MDVFHIESSSINSSLVDDVDNDITEVSFDAGSEFNLNFFDTPDDSNTQGGYSDPGSVDSASICSTPPPPPSVLPSSSTPASLTSLQLPVTLLNQKHQQLHNQQHQHQLQLQQHNQINLSNLNNNNNNNQIKNNNNNKNQQNLLQPPALITIKTGKDYT